MVNPLKKEWRVFYFFPFYHIGGAEKVHYQIAQATGGKDCIIYFTKRSHNDSFLKDFRASGCVIKDISKWTDNKWLYFLNFIYRGIISGYINFQKQKPIVFNGQCNFGYKISPWIKKEIKQVELIHSFNSFSYIRTPFLTFISETIMISKKRIEDHILYYNKINIPDKYIERIRYISNAIKIKDAEVIKDLSAFSVLFVGRGGKEKRIYLVASIAKNVIQKDPLIKFEILGDVSNVVKQSEYPFITFYGDIDDPERINKIYQKASVLLLTSTTEGFPMVIMEAMSYGCAVISTPVGDIPIHVKENINGFLFSTVTDEETIIREGFMKILELKNNPQLLSTISKNNINHSRHNFDIKKFNESYRQLFESLKA